MKKFLYILAAVSIVSSTSVSMISCGVYIYPEDFLSNATVEEVISAVRSAIDSKNFKAEADALAEAEKAISHFINIMKGNPKSNKSLKVEMKTSSSSNDGALNIKITKAKFSEGSAVWEKDIDKEATFNFSIDKDTEPGLISLSKHLIVNDLGYLPDYEEETVFKYLFEKNPNLIASEIEVYGFNWVGANIRVKKDSKIYNQENIPFYYIARRELKEYFKYTQIGYLKNNEEKTIFDKIKETDRNATFSSIDMEVISIDENHIRIKAKEGNDKYKGQIDIYFTLNKIDISKYFIVTELPIKSTSDESYLIDVINRLNPNNNFIKTGMKLVGFSSNKFRITAIEGVDGYFGEAEFTINNI